MYDKSCVQIIILLLFFIYPYVNLNTTEMFCLERNYCVRHRFEWALQLHPIYSPDLAPVHTI